MTTPDIVFEAALVTQHTPDELLTLCDTVLSGKVLSGNWQEFALARALKSLLTSPVPEGLSDIEVRHEMRRDVLRDGAYFATNDAKENHDDIAKLLSFIKLHQLGSGLTASVSDSSESGEAGSKTDGLRSRAATQGVGK